MRSEINRIEDKIENEEKVEAKISRKRPVKDLSELLRLLLDKTQWFKNIKITNKKEQLNEFKKKHERDERYIPDFEFKDYPYNEKVLTELIEDLKDECSKITSKHLENYEAKNMTADDLKKFFRDILEELELYVKLASNIEDEDSWKSYSESIWPMTNQETVEESKKQLLEIKTADLKKNVSPEELKQMFEEELDRISMDYSVEVRETGGCFNIPEEKTVVVAAGEDGERMFSESEAQMLTMHEIFHAIRAYNGFKAGEKTGFPDIIGLHTPFYDRSEEGGALYREEETGTTYPEKEFDYHLRLIAAYKVSETDNFEEEFHEVCRELIDLGATPRRSFELVARNREALRHHIYQAGRTDWKEIENKNMMLIGKLNEEWAEKFQGEIGGMIQEPEITADQIFNFSY